MEFIKRAASNRYKLQTMEPFENIQLAFKCPKALDELQPCQSNWYCDGCRKMVYDFRGMEEAQILQAFAQSGQKLCGVYDADRIKILPQQPRWHKWASTAVMALGVMLLNGCGFGQKDRTITTAGVVLLPPPPKEKAFMDTPPPLTTDTIARPPKVKKIKIKFPPPVVVDDVEVPDTGVKESFVGFLAIDIEPSFPGGETAWTKYIAEHLNYKGDFTGR